MSSRFVSGGRIDSSGEVSNEKVPEDAAVPLQTGHNAEWESVQKELEAERRRREEQRLKAVAGEEKSLYDVLQDNKAAKQAAFEEQNKIKNQFRALDDDEIGFLDEVREKKREEEAAVRRETEEGLKAFRERRKEPEGKVKEQESEEVESWGVGRKRKRVKERDVKGLKRKGSVGGKGEEVEVEKEVNVKEDEVEKPVVEAKKMASAGLVSYDSDDSDD